MILKLCEIVPVPIEHPCLLYMQCMYMRDGWNLRRYSALYFFSRFFAIISLCNSFVPPPITVSGASR